MHFWIGLYVTLTICETTSMGKVLSVATYQGQTRRCVVLAYEHSGWGFIWLLHVIWDQVVEDCSLEQHTPPWKVSL